MCIRDRSPDIVDLAATRQPNLIVTVDNGIASVDGVARARQLGIATLNTDHHLPGDELPAADCIVNPNQMCIRDRITLVVPELIWPEPDDRDALDALPCPGLGTLIARGQLDRRPPQSVEATLADTFGLAGNVAYAALRMLGEDSPPAAADACWLCADPVHLRLPQERLILADGASLGIELAEAAAIVDEFNRQFSDVGVFHVCLLYTSRCV